MAARGFEVEKGKNRGAWLGGSVQISWRENSLGEVDGISLTKRTICCGESASLKPLSHEQVSSETCFCFQL